MVLKLGKFHLPLNEILEDGFQKGRSKGWRAEDLQLSCKRGKPERDLFQSRYLRDLAELRGYMTAKPFVQQRTLYTSDTPDGPAKQYKDPASGISHPLALSYLNWAWGVNAVYHLQLEPFVYDTSKTSDPGILRQVKPPPRKKVRKQQRRNQPPPQQVVLQQQQQPAPSASNNMNGTTTNGNKDEPKQQSTEVASSSGGGMIPTSGGGGGNPAGASTLNKNDENNPTDEEITQTFQI